MGLADLISGGQISPAASGPAASGPDWNAIFASSAAAPPAQAAPAPKPKSGGGGFLSGIVNRLESIPVVGSEISNIGGQIGEGAKLGGQLLNLGEGAVTSTAVNAARGLGELGGASYGSHNASFGNWWEGIVNPKQQVQFGDVLRGAPSKGLNVSVFNDKVPGVRPLTNLSPNPLVQAGIGLAGDIALNPLTYVEPAGAVKGVGRLSSLFADEGATQIGSILGHDISAEGMQAILHGTADMTPYTAEQVAKAQEVASRAGEAIQAVKQGGVSAVPQDLIDQFGAGKVAKGLNLNLGKLGEVPLTSGEGPLSALSQGRYLAQSKLGDLLRGASPEAGGLLGDFGQTAPELKGGLKAENPSDVFHAQLQLNARALGSASRSALSSTVRNVLTKAIGNASEADLSAAHDIINGADPAGFTSAQQDLAKSLSDAHQQIGELMVQRGMIGKERLLPNGEYFPSPSDQNSRQLVESLGITPPLPDGAKANTAFFERARTFFQDGKFQLGEGPLAISGTAKDRAEAVSKVGELLAQRAQQVAEGDPNSAVARLLSQNPELASRVKDGSVPIFEQGREALLSQAQKLGSRYGNMVAARQLFKGGMGAEEGGHLLQSDFAEQARLRTITQPEQVAPAADAHVTAVEHAMPASAAGQDAAKVGTQAEQVAVLRASPEAAQSAGRQAAEKWSQAAGVPAEAAAPTAEIPPTPATTSPLQTIGALQPPEGAPQVQGIGQEPGLPGQPATETPTANTPPNPEPTVPTPTPTVSQPSTSPASTYAQDQLNEVTGAMQGLGIPDHLLNEAARVRIAAALADNGKDVSPELVTRMFEQDPLARNLVDATREQVRSYLKMSMMQPGMLTPADAAEAVSSFERYGGAQTGLGKAWQQYIRFSRVWQLTNPGMSVKRLVSGILLNAQSGEAMDYAAAGADMLGRDLSPEAQAVKDAVDRVVAPGEPITELGKGTSFSQLGSDTSNNPLSTQGPVVRTMRQVNNAADQWVRRAMAYGMFQNGAADSEVVNALDKFHFNFSDLTEGEQRLRANLFPFYTFTKNNLGLQLEQLVNNPKMFSYLSAARRELQAQSPADKITPDWFKTSFGVRLPFMSGGGHEYALPQLPQTQLSIPNEVLHGLFSKGNLGQRLLATANPLVAQTAPAAVGLAGLAENQNPFYGTPFKNNAAKNEFARQKTIPLYKTLEGLTGKQFGVPAPAQFKGQPPAAGPAIVPQLLHWLTGTPIETNTKQQQSAVQFFQGLSSGKREQVTNTLSAKETARLRQLGSKGYTFSLVGGGPKKAKLGGLGGGLRSLSGGL